MRYSKLFGKTVRRAPKEAKAISHQLLVRAGYINQLMAGVYSFLPLGWRVHQKIGDIIREEMNAIGGQEVFLPTLQPKSLWEETGRWEEMEPPLFKLRDQHKKELTLGPTHEEVVTDLVRQQVRSYRDLPFSLYQIQNKFRNEVRSTGGLLRVREFVMKDLYSFDIDKKSMSGYFQKVIAAYKKIFSRCGLKAVICQASGGTIGGSETYEFHILAPVGEDKVAFCSKCGWGVNQELAGDKKKCPQCGQVLQFSQSIEAGHVFALGTKYSQAMKAEFIDHNGQKKPVWMGCYGIGLGRLMATIVEVSHDKKGIIWPASVAPYAAHLLAVDPETAVRRQAEKIYLALQKAGLEVLFDDREDVSAGSKFADADLIGIPVRLVVSVQTGAKVEWKNRVRPKTELLTLEQAIKRLAE